jgi:hypothetical protein
MSRRRRKRRTSLAVLLTLVALALTAGLLWRWIAFPPVPPEVETPRTLHTAPGSQPAAEEFSPSERQRLDDILRQKKAAAVR